MTTAQKSRSDRKYTRRTITIPAVASNSEDSGSISKSEARTLLDIETYDTINDYFDLLGYESDYITWQQFKRLLMLQAFLGIKHGSHKKKAFLEFSEKDLMVLFNHFCVDINKRFERIKNDYNQR